MIMYSIRSNYHSLVQCLVVVRLGVNELSPDCQKDPSVGASSVLVQPGAGDPEYRPASVDIDEHDWVLQFWGQVKVGSAGVGHHVEASYVGASDRNDALPVQLK